MLQLKQYRSTSPAFSDLLNYASVIDDGIVLNKDGSLMAGWYYRGQDLETVSANERNSISAKINAALVKLGSEWALHQDVIRIKSSNYSSPKKSHFPDFISRLIDEERRIHFENDGMHFENINAITLTYLPDKTSQAKLAEMMFDDSGDVQKLTTAEQALKNFKSAIADFEDRVSSFLQLFRLKGEEYEDEHGTVHVCDHLLSYLHQIITGEQHYINLPPCPMYLDAIIGSQEFWTGLIPKINNKYIQTISIDGFPAECYPSILSALDNLSGEYRWNTRFIFQDSVDADKALQKYKKKWEQKVRGFVNQIFYSKQTSSGAINEDALHMVQQIETAISENSSGLVAYGYYTATIILMNEDRDDLEQMSRNFKRIINNLHFSARVETVNTVDAYLGSLPSHVVQNLRRPLMNTLQVSDLLPLSSIWAGNDYAPCPFFDEDAPPLLYAATDGSTPFRLNIHIGDLGHTLMFGPTGAGKSTALALLAVQFLRYRNANIFAFDKGRSLEPLARAVGGKHYDVGNMDKVLAFSPLALIDNSVELAWAREWIETLCELQGVMLKPQHRSLILDALKQLQNDPEKTLTNLVVNVQSTELKEALKDYTISGAFGEVLDCIDDGLSVGHFSVFEIEELMNLNERIQLPVLLYLFRVIERQLKGQPSLLILDEAWLMLANPVFKEKIREWLKVLRKANCAVMIATQSLSDAVKSGILDVLSESCPTKIFLGNPDAKNEENASIYKNMGCNDTEIALISDLRKKREYYIKSPEGKRRINFQIGEIALSFIGVSDKESLQSVREFNRKYGDEWAVHWLENNNINYTKTLERIS